MTPRHDYAVVFDQPLPFRSPGGIMRCPSCNQNTPDDWKRLYPALPRIIESEEITGFDPMRPTTLDGRHDALVAVDWMKCANNECLELVVAVQVWQEELGRDGPWSHHLGSWLAYPRGGYESRDIPPEVPDNFKRDYEEAAAILDASPRMSAVLSRSILADLLEKYAKLTDFNLSNRITAFRADINRPADLRESIDHFREIADFGAHTQRNDQDEIIPVDRESAAWMLEFLDRLFNYFIVEPAKHQQMRERWDKNLADAGRKPIDPLPDDPISGSA